MPLVIGLERDRGQVSRFETLRFPGGPPAGGGQFPLCRAAGQVPALAARRLEGVYRRAASIGEFIRECYSPHGPRAFDYHFMGEQVYEQPFTVVPCDPRRCRQRMRSAKPLGRHLDGCRIGFDLGASDRKVSAVIDGQVRLQRGSDLGAAQADRPRIPLPRDHDCLEDRRLEDAARGCDRRQLGGDLTSTTAPWWLRSSAAFPQERFHEIQNLFLRIREEMGVPLEVINDGDVTALAGSMSLEDNGILGIAMGSSEAAGYVDLQRAHPGLAERAGLRPDRLQPAARRWMNGPATRGLASQYFSQQCVFRLAPRAGIQIPSGPDRRRKAEVRPGKAGSRARRRTQNLAEHGRLPGLRPGALRRFL